MKNILILAGGGSAEHEISLICADHIQDQLDKVKFNPILVEVCKDKTWKLGGEKVTLNWKKELETSDSKLPIHASIPWIPGYPGETGHITAFFDLIGLGYLGCETESHMICFNKVLTKMWCEKLEIPITDFEIIHSADQLDKAEKFFDKHSSAFLKASNQGSSVGCYPIYKKDDLATSLKDAFNYSQFVIIERLVNVRELEISVFEYKGKVHVTTPCEIHCPDKFYSYDEKYSKESHTKVDLVAQLKPEVTSKIQELAERAFRGLKLRHGVRMDFFLEGENGVLLNEINTYPGLTSISMYPKMMQNYGVEFRDFMSFHLDKLTNSH